MSEKFGGSKETPIGQIIENRSILKELNAQENSKHSPLNSKSGGAINKSLTPTSKTPTISSLLNTTPNNNNTLANTTSRETTPAAAGTAHLEDNDSAHSLQIEADSLLNVELFGNTIPKRLSTKFIALRDFNETDLPDLPDELDPEFCEDPLKLSFSEGISRKLSADSSATFDVNKFKEDVGQFLTVYDTDTALSSDNETYAECQSYRDSELNYEYPLETSGAEQFQSAFNSHENTLNCDQLSTAFDEQFNILPIINEDHLALPNFLAKMNTTSEPEPMDVDTNSTLEMSNNSSNNTTVEADNNLKKQFPCSNKATPEKSFEHVQVEKNVAKRGNDSEQQNEQKIENLEKKTEIESSQVLITPQMKPIAEDQLKIGTACSEISKVDSENTGEIPAIDDENNKSQSLTASLVVAMPQSPNVSVSPLKLDISTNSDSNLSLSPSFPLKPQSDTSKFPASPTQSNGKQGIFLEPSLVVKTPSPQISTIASATASFSPVSYLNSTFETGLEIKRRSPSPKINTFNETFNGNMNISPAAAMSGDENMSNFNKDKRRTFDVLTAKSENAAENVSNVFPNNENHKITLSTPETIADKQVLNEETNQCNVETPTVLQLSLPISEEQAQREEIKNQHTLNNLSDSTNTETQNDETKPTKTVLSLSSIASEQLKQLNESSEAMEVDESFTVRSPGVVLRSPSLPAQLAQHKASLALSPFKGSSSLSFVLNANPTVCSTATVAAAQILSKSSSLVSKFDASDVQDAFKMPPPLRKPSLENKKRSLFHESPQMSTEILSEKEQTKSASKDEKDIFIEKFTPSPKQESTLAISNPFSTDAEEFSTNNEFQSEFWDEDFKGKIILQPSDFDYLFTKGSSNEPVDRSSLLLRFDPLVGGPVLVNNAEKQQENLQRLLQKVTGAGNSAASSSSSSSNNNNNSTNNTTNINSSSRFGNGNEKSCLKAQTIQEKEEQLSQVQGDSNNENSSPPVDAANTLCAKEKGSELIEQPKKQNIQANVAKAKRHANMSVDVIKDINNIDNDCTKNNYELSNSQSDEKQANYKMDELEKKIKNEVLKTEDIEKKLKEAEQREEALIKRITEKDKQILKMSNVTESYEKSIAEFVAEKEQIVQNYEKQLAEVSADRDSNYSHLMSLETTFSDLHVKYEKSKEMTAQLKASEESLLAEKRQNLENLQKQEQRYEKMKYHAMQQLDIANKKLEAMKKEYAVETTKLKAQLKKEEISRASLNEQLQQKTRENQELVKICDELISGQGS